MKKIILSLATIFLLTGCTSDLITKSYNKTLPGKDGINGYTLDVRVSEKTTDGITRENLRVKNYMNEDFEIIRINAVSKLQETTYIVDNQKFISNDDEYVIEEEDIKYDQPKLYLELLNNIVDKSKVKETKLGENTYRVYDVVFDQEHVTKIANDLIISEQEITGEVTGKIYIDKDNYVYRIDIGFNKVDVVINFFGFDKAREIIVRN